MSKATKQRRKDILSKTRELRHLLYHETMHALEKKRSGEAVIYNEAMDALRRVDQLLSLRIGLIKGPGLHMVDGDPVECAMDEE